ncbi:MAG: hypothetical protein R3345_00605 [Fulvivirga sp.]|nr:hypothetical protein [Fulvivirga sp.]
MRESSGLIAFNDSILITHNDSGNGPLLYFLNTKGNVLKNVRVLNSINYDWEDICQDSLNIYIGDIGNNSNRRKSLQIYKISKKDLLREENVKAEKIEFNYEDQKQFPPPRDNMRFDAEGIIAFKDSLYIFSKNHTDPYDGLLTIYRVPKDPGVYTAKIHQQVKILANSWLNNNITAATVSDNERNIALLTHDKIWYLKDFNGTDFFSGSIQLLQLNFISQKEAIAFSKNGTLFITDEYLHPLIGGNLYEFNLMPFLLNKEN